MQPCPYRIEMLLPHAAPMILLDRVTGYETDRLVAEVTVRASAPLFRPEGMPAHVAIEYMAQACGCLVGLEARLAGEVPRIGLLLGTRNFNAARAWIAAGTHLTVVVFAEYRDGDMGFFDCRVDDREGMVAAAQLTLHRTSIGGGAVAG
jgi:predicted hotdog family 3-hydroxylacyl-ACP dehydratase